MENSKNNVLIQQIVEPPLFITNIVLRLCPFNAVGNQATFKIWNYSVVFEWPQ